MKNKIYYIILATIFIGSGLWFFVGEKKSALNPQENAIDVSGSTSSAQFDKTSGPLFENKKSKNEATLKVGDKTYGISIEEGLSVYDAMKRLSESLTAEFSFKAKEYSGMGYFIEEIKGIKNAGGTYWTLYVNGTRSDVGASNYRLKSGDRVEWRYE